MVPYVKHHKLPLLPFERELIRALGATEEEYRFFVAEAERLSQRQPALGYEHVPDIRMGPVLVPILISLAVGVAVSAAAYLLTPKPKSPSEARQRQLSSLNGSDRFSPTSGFDSLAQLANYEEPIPIVFGLYTGSTGGVLVSPKLVWSRAFSFGTQQGVKMMFVVGEQGSTAGIPAPALEGIFLGTSPLDAAFDHTFAFYWASASTSGSSRIRSSNLRYGTRNGLSTGDPEPNSDVLLLPMKDLVWKPGFSTSYSPTNNSQFGAHSAIHNGTDYRVNFRIISILEVPDADDDPGNQLRLERLKISGNYLGAADANNLINVREYGMAGIGREYSRRMGIIGVNNTLAVNTKDLMVASVGSTCVFSISGTRIPGDFYLTPTAQNTKVDDINDEIDSLCAAADAQLQLGETFQIGMTLWKVTNRSVPIWQENSSQNVTLTCVEVLEQGDRARIGVIQPQLLEIHVTADNTHLVPTGFFPLMRAQIGLVRNSRSCDATEFGLKSQVWNRASGLCNFASLPTPAALSGADANRVSLASGTMTQYFQRASVFTIYVRPAGLSTSGAQYAWSRLGNSFCVRGDQPVDIYNFVRIIHPAKGQYEFRFVPRPGSDLYYNSSPTELLIGLDARGGTSLIALSQSTAYGTFQVFTSGYMTPISSITTCPQTQVSPGTADARLFELDTQIADVSYYANLLTKSNDSQPEHTVSYVNEFVDNPAAPAYTDLTTSVLALKASRTYSSLDQVRAWLPNGISVKRFHPLEANTVGPSNLLTDLIYYLLTDKTAGAGNAISPDLINTADLAATATFLRANQLFFDGAISESVNIRQYIGELSPFFLCNFVIANGRFSIVPAVPTTTAGLVSNAAVKISGLFTSGNILENTFNVEYVDSEERNRVQAVMRYRQGGRNQLPEERTLVVRWNEAAATSHKIESFDMTAYCTSRAHALLAAKFVMSVRRRITHTVRFKTTPYGMNLAPGEFIRVVTQSSPYSGANNGVIDDDGVVTSATQLANGSYSIIYYKPPADSVATGTLTVSDGVTTQTALFGSVFTVTTTNVSSNVYMIEQLTIDEDGMVEISASEFPTTTGYSSLVAQDILSTTAFTTEG